MSVFSRKLSSTQRIVFSFIAVILVGSLLLSMPISQLSSSQATYWDNLFTAVSMVCVTGLSTVPVAETFTTFGQVICMILIQIGGLSLISFIGLLALYGRKKLSFVNMTTLQEALSVSETRHFRSFIFTVFRFTFITELIGACLLAFHFVPKLGWFKGIFTSIFLGISAFCNAGFDNLGSTSLQNYLTNPLINLTIAALIIMGGLGFSVWFDLRSKLTSIGIHRKLRFHTRVVLVLTLIILSAGTLTTLITEYNNPYTIGNLPFFQKVMASFFQTVTMRTAGFATIDYTQAHSSTLLVYLFQMMLGGAPGGTAGGIKITAFLTLFLYARSEINGLPHTNLGHHTIDPLTIRKAFAVSSIFIVTFLAGFWLLNITDPGKSVLYLAYEAMSALATVGVTANLTPHLSQAGQFILMALMFFGRVGPMSFLLSLSTRKPSREKQLQYAQSSMMV